MSGDHLKKVQPGDPLAIPAATFNAFVDAAQDYRNRQHRQDRPMPPAAMRRARSASRTPAALTAGRKGSGTNASNLVHKML